MLWINWIFLFANTILSILNFKAYYNKPKEYRYGGNLLAGIVCFIGAAAQVWVGVF